MQLLVVAAIQVLKCPAKHFSTQNKNYWTQKFYNLCYYCTNLVVCCFTRLYLSPSILLVSDWVSDPKTKKTWKISSLTSWLDLCSICFYCFQNPFNSWHKSNCALNDVLCCNLLSLYTIYCHKLFHKLQSCYFSVYSLSYYLIYFSFSAEGDRWPNCHGWTTNFLSYLPFYHTEALLIDESQILWNAP